MLRITGAFGALAFFVLAFTVGAHHADPNSFHNDFDLYYFGGVQERVGSYTQDHAVFALAQAHARAVNPNGVFGAPALVAFVFMPLSLLSVGNAEVVWYVLTAALVFFSVRYATRKYWPAALVALLCTYSMLDAVQLGNASVLTFCFIAIAYGAMRDDRPALAGVMLGLAGAFKIYPLFLLLVPLVRRQWKTLITGATSAIALTLLTIPLFGYSDFVKAAHRVASLGGTTTIWPDNDSIAGVLLYATHNATLSRIVGDLGLLIAAALVVLIRKHRPQDQLAVAAVLMLVAQSLSWGMYFTVALLLAISVTQIAKMIWYRVVVWLAFFVATSSPFYWPSSSHVPDGLAKLVGLIVMLTIYLLVTLALAATRNSSAVLEESPAL